MLRERLKDNRGLTLIELLAVIVILGIIAAIAVPSIGNIIDNSKKDAHIANAEQMVSAVRLAKASNVDGSGTDKNVYTLKYLESKGLLESVPEAPGNAGGYDEDESKVEVSDGNYTVWLDSKEGGYYINGKTISKLRADDGRDDVKLDGTE